MLKVRLNLSKMVAIATCFAVTTMLSGCDKEKEEDPNNPTAIEGGVVINGVVWAECNVDAPGTFAAKPEDAGMFYQWNRKIGWSAIDPLVNSIGGHTWDNSLPEGTAEWIATNDPSPAGWRIPTIEEVNSLFNSEKVTNEWTTHNGVNGRKFTDKTTGASILTSAIICVIEKLKFEC